MTTTPPESGKAAENSWLRLPGAFRFPYGKAPNGDQPAGVDAEEEVGNEGAAAADEELPAGPILRSRRSPLARIRAPIARLSLRSRIALLVALAVALAVAVSSIAAYVTVRNRLHASVDENLLIRAKSAAATGLRTSSQLTQSAYGTVFGRSATASAFAGAVLVAMRTHDAPASRRTTSRPRGAGGTILTAGPGRS